ncbi:MAG: hypothetical protein U0736_00895 [Gemmataceae bacterium]
MNVLVVLAAVAGWCPTCGGGWCVAPEWLACPPGRPDAGLVALFFEKAPTVGPQVEKEWCDYVELLDFSDQGEIMALWHKADVNGKLCLINQVRLMKVKRDQERQKNQAGKPDKEQPEGDGKKIERSKDGPDDKPK